MHNDYFVGKAVCFIAAGYEHSLALTLNGLIYAWGSNSRGQLGICTLGKDFKRVGLPRLLEANLKEPGTLLACGRKSTFFGVAGQHPDAHTYLFNQWKKKLIEEDRRLQERANYHYSIIRRQINYDKLTKRIKSEREQQLQRVSPRPADHHDSPRRHVSASESYYEFWNLSKFVSSEDQRRQVFAYERPAHEGKKGAVTVTVFKGIQRKTEGKKPHTSSPDLRDAVNFASIDGSIALDQALGVLSAPMMTTDPERPVYYERTDFEPPYRHYATLKTQGMFAPYTLVPNPMLLGSSRR